MFEDLENVFGNIKTVSIPIETDEFGFIDKQCPQEECEFLFKVNAEDWKNIFRDEAVWCPSCRHEAPAKNWFTIEQANNAQEQALEIIKGHIHNALLTSAQKFNQRQKKNTFISMSMKIEGGVQTTHPIPIQSIEAMQLIINCENCNARFAVIGSAFFCPACGHNSVERTFSDSLRKIHAKIASIPIIRAAIIEASDKDSAEITCRSLRETCISDGVVAFQRLCEILFVKFGQHPFNAFQRLSQGSQLWEQAIGIGYNHWLSESELTLLNKLYQKRHILAHNDGVVDEQYIQKSRDSAYIVGQKIIVSDAEILTMTKLLERLAQGLLGKVKKE